MGQVSVSGDVWEKGDEVSNSESESYCLGGKGRENGFELELSVASLGSRVPTTLLCFWRKLAGFWAVCSAYWVGGLSLG